MTAEYSGPGKTPSKWWRSEYRELHAQRKSVSVCMFGMGVLLDSLEGSPGPYQLITALSKEKGASGKSRARLEVGVAYRIEGNRKQEVVVARSSVCGRHLTLLTIARKHQLVASLCPTPRKAFLSRVEYGLCPASQGDER